jgi:hypothetical protein
VVGGTNSIFGSARNVEVNFDEVAGQAPPQARLFRSVTDLQAAINRFLDDLNARSSPSNASPIPTKSSPPSDPGAKR